jgi:hypothetical protein
MKQRSVDSPASSSRTASCHEATRVGHGAAPGVGVPCAVCARPVTSEEIEYEVQFAHDGANPGLARFHLHLRCFAVWELERTKVP